MDQRNQCSSCRQPRRARLTVPVGTVAVAFCLLAQPAAAQDTTAAATRPETAERCRAPEYRQFDFWIGSWEVRNDADAVVGHNEIRRVAGGCGLHEDWRGVSGGDGVSINTYDSQRQRWTQRWVGAGAILWLEGGLDGDKMVLTGTSPRVTPRGDLLDRITWTPLPDGRVQQVWHVSADNGETWSRIFNGFYAPAPPPAPALPPVPAPVRTGSS